jgi:PQ loop repeat
MMLLWACAGVPLGVYNIVENFNIALRIQPQILTFLSLLTWMQCKYYGNKWPLTKSCAVAAPVAVILGGVEFGLVFGLRKAREEQMHWPITLMAVLSACLLCAGVLRHYWDIYRERTVRGISFIFVAIDALGDLTSLISVFFEPRLDILGMVIYGSELILWCGVMACGGYFNFRPWAHRRLDKWKSKRREEVNPGQYEGCDRPEDAPARSLSTVFRTASSSSGHTIQDQDRFSDEIRQRNVGNQMADESVFQRLES